jgi:general stress protein YciG
MSEKLYVFDYYLFASRRGHLQWIWEIRRKSKPDQRYFSADGFRSAKAAEEAGKIVLAEVRKAASEDRATKQAAMALDRNLKVARRIEEAVAKANRNTPERRSENARIAAIARAKALSPERRSEIGRKGGSASKGKPKIKKHVRPPNRMSANDQEL